MRLRGGDTQEENDGATSKLIQHTHDGRTGGTTRSSGNPTRKKKTGGTD